MKYRLFTIALACAFVTLAKAAPPTTGAYVSDPQSEYVQDQTSEGISEASQILCFLSNTRSDAMVNLGKYVAFIDESQCGTSKSDASSSSSEGGGSSTSYTRMSLTSTRESATSAQIGKGHAALTMGGSTPAYVYVYTSITEAPTATNTNGALSMNFAALPVGSPNKIMRGKISTSASGIQFSSISSGGSGSSNTQLAVSGNATAGSGAISYPGTTLTFGYNASTFCRNDGATTTCFDRSKTNATTSTWRYGVYTDGTGARYDVAQAGFPVRNTATGEYGHAGYWGIWFPSAVTNGATLASLATTPVTYTVNKTGGRLTKYTWATKTLNEVQKVPFNFMPQTAVTIVTTDDLAALTRYEMYWNGSNFIANARMVCSSAGCFREPLSTPLSITPAQLNAAASVTTSATPPTTINFGVNGWSQALGGNVMIPASTLLGVGGSPGTLPIKYNTQAVVAPGDPDVPGTLKCARDCPTVANYASLTVANISSASAYTAGTNRKRGGTAAAAVVTYTWDGATYTLKKNDVDTAITNSLLTASGISLSSYPIYASGIRSGALVDATSSAWSAGGAMDCGTTGSFFCDFKSNNLPSFYVWENGTSPHQSATFLKKPDNTFVAFTPPESASFVVPNEAKYGQFAGANLNLKFNGFGRLHGIPGKCFSMSDNAEVNCGPSTRYVPAFSIPENTSTSEFGKVTMVTGGATKWIKYLDREIRFKKIGVDTSITLGSTSSLPAALSLTGVDTEDPSNSSNSNYAGSVQASDFLNAPSVIHGVVQ